MSRAIPTAPCNTFHVNRPQDRSDLQTRCLIPAPGRARPALGNPRVMSGFQAVSEAVITSETGRLGSIEATASLFPAEIARLSRRRAKHAGEAMSTVVCMVS